MNDEFVSLAREVFAAACGDGPSKLPTGTTQFMQNLGKGMDLTDEALESLGQQLTEEFPIWPHRSISAMPVDETTRSTWEAAVRAVVLHLRRWVPSNCLSFDELSALLLSLETLGLNSADIPHFATQLENDALVYGLYHLIRQTEVGSYLRGHDRTPNAEQEIKVAALQRNYLKISHILPHIMPEAHPVLWAAVRLLWRLDPAKLAEALTIKNSVYLALLVQFTLNDDFPALALRVPVMWLKYASIDHMENAHRRGSSNQNWAELLHQLLLQAADTPVWSAWMDATLRAPQSGSLMCIALPKALASLQLHHWDAVLSAVHLSFSMRSAEPMASMMAALAQEVGETAVSSMWSMCFDRWNHWDYGKNEPQTYLFAPAACAFDFPVAMHYAKMSSHERNAVEAALTLAVETIEQQWFDSATDLVTERNRLLSRLRLVVHGRMLANGETNLLPPAIQPPDAYTRVRYRYYDTQSPLDSAIR
ncbi:hypothetical protein [Burkholderia pseudomallei]|uniref:hypothetical protein n=1 Tax=Burkholderia pseudomallei TaxID=28450 RepID=UPI0005D81F2A|nr:hypothetical protein [Burkholderia pseudomallei]AJX72177.1 hypothetical protein BG19_2197 [Burkholderia pseudomallei MSHR840]